MSRTAPRNISPVVTVETVARELVRVRSWGEASFINLPLLFPSGTAATVRVQPIAGGFRVDDAGFAYRELESVGAERSFPKAARKVAEAEGLMVNTRLLYADVSEDALFRGICDVGAASRDLVERVYGKLAEHEEAEITDFLQERLEHVFGKARVDGDAKVTGSSSNEWEVSAVVHTDSGLVVFQAVSGNAYSVYRTSTAFHDLRELPNPPKRIAVVKDTEAMGAKLAVLAQAGMVIQGDQPDAVYQTAAAA